ncbi:MAG: B12-binding domain-containing radical SAM protein [Candidatus Omnitrophota bacterium]
MKCLCIVPYEYTTITMMYRNSPVGIYKVATKLRREGHTVELFNMYPLYRPRKFIENKPDAMYFKGIPVSQFIGYKKCGNFENEKLCREFHRLGLPISELTKKLEKFQPDRIFVGNTFTFLWRAVYEIVAECKRVMPKVPVKVGGLYAILCPEHAKALGADEVMTLEEKTASDNFIKIDTDLFGDNLPDRIFLGTSVGCPNHCSYCAVHIVEGCTKVNTSPDEVVSELKYYKSMGISRFIFLDANILYGYENHFKIILDKVIQENLNIELYSYGGVEARLLTDDISEKMVNAGFRSVNIPIESASDIIIKEWKRNCFVADWERAMNVAKRHFQRLRSFLIIGAPNQTTEDIRSTIDLIKSYGAEAVTLPYTPIPGTPDYEKYKRIDLEDLNPAFYPCAHETMKAADLEKFYSENRNVRFCLRNWEDVQQKIPPPTKTIFESGPAVKTKGGI